MPRWSRTALPPHALLRHELEVLQRLHDAAGAPPRRLRGRPLSRPWHSTRTSSMDVGWRQAALCTGTNQSSLTFLQLVDPRGGREGSVPEMQHACSHE